MFWDQVAGVYDIFVNVINRKTHKILKEIVSDLIEPDDVVLECACGTGLLSAVIAQKCRRLTATDFSEMMLKKAEKKTDRMGFRIPGAARIAKAIRRKPAHRGRVLFKRGSVLALLPGRPR